MVHISTIKCERMTFQVALLGKDRTENVLNDSIAYNVTSSGTVII